MERSRSWPDPTSCKVVVLGLGYVGLPLLAAFAARQPACGVDPDARACLAATERGLYAGSELAPQDANTVYIVAVPTPVDGYQRPDFSALRAASMAIGAVLRRGQIVVFESTVYPGATREICVPELEKASGLACDIDFAVGYSPERINPGDPQHQIAEVIKVTSASNPAAAIVVDQLYARVVQAGTHLAPTIEVAEAAKALENTQRDVNIALMNELAMLASRIDLDLPAVLAAARTKWNFAPYHPGLVGGHCIGVDPYYLVHRSQQVGFEPELIRAARRINSQMSTHVVQRVLALSSARGLALRGAAVLVLGLAFKANCADLRNTRVVEIVGALAALGAEIDIVDPHVDRAAAQSSYGLTVHPQRPEGRRYAMVLGLVAHRAFVDLTPAAMGDALAEPALAVDLWDVLPSWPGRERI